MDANGLILSINSEYDGAVAVLKDHSLPPGSHFCDFRHYPCHGRYCFQLGVGEGPLLVKRAIHHLPGG
jgi:hypothetical protein